MSIQGCGYPSSNTSNNVYLVKGGVNTNKQRTLKLIIICNQLGKPLKKTRLECNISYTFFLMKASLRLGGGYILKY